jgi:uncharacterized DUF497 family protein
MSTGPHRPRFTWDETKRSRNLAKHGVDFSAIDAFDWHEAVLRPDRRFDYGEERWVAVGPIRDRLHVVVYVVRQDGHRLVSLRRANSREGRFHAAAIDRTDA